MAGAPASGLPRLAEKLFHNVYSGPIHFTAVVTRLNQESERLAALATRKPVSGAKTSSSGPSFRGQRSALLTQAVAERKFWSSS